MKRPTPPPRSRAFNETLSWLEFPRLLFNAPALMRAPRGDGGRVIVFPGFGAGDGSTALLRQYLTSLGHDVSGWNLGRNLGDVLQSVYSLTDAVREESHQISAPVTLIGWSLGGYLAREVARELPTGVKQVITLGSPVIGGPKYTQVASVFAERGEDLDEIERLIESRERVPITTPVTALYSRFDGIVSWEACIDHKSPNVEHIEVTTTHIGLGFSSDVYRIIATRLAAEKPKHRS